MKNPYLNLLSKNAKIVIPFCEGAEKINLLNSKKVFPGKVGDLIREIRPKNPEQPSTQATEVEVHETVQRIQYFTDVFTDPDNQFLTQTQVVKFLEDNPEWVKEDGWGTYFLCKKKGTSKLRYFVVCVYLDDNDLKSIEIDLLYETSCIPGRICRFVIPVKN